MSDDSNMGRRLTTMASAGWAVTILVLYVVWRPEDVQPVLAALGDRVLDLSVPVGLWLVHLPLGSWISRSLFPTDERPGSLEWVIRASAMGLGVAMGTTALGAAIGWIGPTWIMISAAACALVSAREWRASAEHLLTSFRDFGREILTFPGAAVVVILGLALLTVLTPAVSQDALHYHLEVPKRWLAAGGFTDVPGNIYSRFPMNVELLYLDGLALRGEIAAKAWHWLFAALTAGALRLLAGRFSQAKIAMWAPAIFLAIPSVFRVSTWAYVEMGLIFFLIVGWDALVSAKVARRDRPPLVLAGICFGLACGIKYTAVPIALAVSIIIAVQSISRRWMHASVFALSTAATGGFWYIKNWIEVGNPVYPFLYSWFGGPGWDLERDELFRACLREWGDVGWGLPFSLTFDATFASIDRFDGIVGPALLIATPLLARVAWKRPQVRGTFALAAVMIVLWLTTTQQIRFLLPGLAVLFALLPVALETTASEIERRVYSVALVGCVSLSLVSHVILFGREAPVAFAVGLESTEQNRARRLPGGDAALFARIATHVGPHERILFAASGNPVFLCERPYHADSVVENYTLRRLLEEGTPAEFASRFEAMGFTHLLFRSELIFGRTGEQTDLSLDEQKLLAALLNEHAQLDDRAGGTFLYRITTNGVDR